MLEGGDLMFQGVAIEPMFFKGLFDKFGVKADMIRSVSSKALMNPIPAPSSPREQGELDSPGRRPLHRHRREPWPTAATSRRKTGQVDHR